MIGGAVPIPGGAGVIEVGLIAGLQRRPAIPQVRPWRTVLIERFCHPVVPAADLGLGHARLVAPQRLRVTATSARELIHMLRNRGAPVLPLHFMALPVSNAVTSKAIAGGLVG